MSARSSRALLGTTALCLLAAAALALLSPVPASATGHSNVNPGVRPFVALLDSSSDPIAPDASGAYRISPTPGSATTLNLRVYMVKTARTTLPATSDYARYGDFSYVYMGIASGPNVWPKLTGATWSDTSLCGDQTGLYGAGGEDCNMLKTKWAANARAADTTLSASDTEAGDPVHPLDLTITIPAGTTSFTFASLTDCRSDGTACSHNGNPDNNDAGNNRIRNQATQAFSDGGFQAHIYRYQPAFYAVREDGSIDWGDVSTTMDATHTVRSAQLCTEAHMTSGNAAYDANSDCNRAVRIGEAIYLPNTLLQQSGAARNGNFWLDATGGTRVKYGQYDTVTLSVPAGMGFVGTGTFCPVDVAIHPADLEPRYSPRDRTAADLASCTWQSTVADDAETTLWNGDGALFFPTAAGTVTATVTFAKADDPDTAWDDSFSASDTIDITVTATGAEPIKAYLGRRKLDNALSLQIGRKYADGLPSQWGFGPVTEPGGEGYVAGAAYDDVDETEAVVLTVPAGTLELLGQSGAVSSCTADPRPCTLTISRADLKAAARAGWTGDSADPIEDNAHIYLAKLRYSHAPGATADVEINGVLKLDDGSTEDFSYTAKASALAAPAIAGYPRGDADALLAPGQTAAISVGYHLPAEETGSPSRLLRPTPDIWAVSRYVGPELNSRLRVVQEHAVRSATLPATLAGAYLQVSGPAAWTANGDRRLNLGQTYADGTYGYFTCMPSTMVEPGADEDSSVCLVTNADGNAPSITVDADAASDVTIIAKLPVWTLGAEDSPLDAASGMPIGTEAHRDAVWHQRIEAFGSIVLSVGTITEVSSVSLTRKDGQTGAVKTNDPARLKLAVLSESGRASAASAISSITITSTAGTIRAGATEGEDEFCSGSTTCTITIGTTGDDNADDLASRAAANPALVGGIFIDLYGVRTAGTATVSATVVATSGDDPIFRAEPLTVIFSGNAASLSLAETLLRVNAYGTPDADVEADPTADPPVAAVSKDDRDVIKIAVTATDSRGQTADVPRGTPSVLDPDGNPVITGISASIPDDECNTGRTACNIVIDVNAPASAPLKSGIYKISLSSGSLTAATTSFGVAGDPAEITIQLDDPGAVGTSFEADILVVDEAGEPVADGTAVAVAVERRGRAPAAVQRTSPATQRTANGRITAKFVVVSREVSTIKATAGSASTLAVANTTEVSSPEEDRPAQGLGTTQTNTYTTWSGAGSATAAALLADLGSGADRVFLWNGVRWLVYAEVNGRPIPGSINYLIQANDVLWIGTAAN